MKIHKLACIVLAVMAGGLAAPAQPASNAPAAQAVIPVIPSGSTAVVQPASNVIVIVAPAPAATNAVASEPEKPMTPTNMVRMNFHDVPLSTVLQALSAEMGFVFSSDVEVRGNATIVSEQPVGTNDVLELLRGALAKNNYALSANGHVLTITSTSGATTGATTPVFQAASPTNIPMSDEIATIVLPVHTLNPTQLIKDLAELVPPGAVLAANESGNALIMTAREKDVHRFAEIIAALDSSSVADVGVFILKYADAKSVADELKEIFQSPDSTVSRSDRQRFRGFGGFGGGGFGGLGGGGGSSDNSSEQKNAADKAVFVSDDQMNAVVASAPRDYFPGITNIIAELDQPNQDVTVMRVFHLRFADAQETADELANLFPDPTKTSDQNSRSSGMRFLPPWMQQQPAGNNESPRMKLQTTVRAVPDMRTASVVVTASRDMMDQIAGVIEDLDHDPAGVQGVYVYPLDTADPTTVQAALTQLFQSQTSRSQQSTTQSALQQREQSGAQSQSQTSTTTGFGTGSGGGTQGLH